MKLSKKIAITFAVLMVIYGTSAMGQPAPGALTVATSGDVLIAGGQDAPDSGSTAAEVFNPSSQTFSRVGDMSYTRIGAIAFVPRTGKLADHPIVTGGQWQFSKHRSKVTGTSELFDPATGSFTKGPRIKMELDIEAGSVVELADGRFLIIAGSKRNKKCNCVLINLAMIYDPVKHKFSKTRGTLLQGRWGAAMARISGCGCSNEGKVLIAGGYYKNTLAEAELFDPATGKFSATGSMNSARVRLTATTLNDGTVLVAGGQGSSGPPLDTAEIYDPATGTFSLTTSKPGGTNMNSARAEHTATLLNDGTVLIAGGRTNDETGSVIDSAEVYDPSAFAFTAVSPMNSPRFVQSATLIEGSGTALDGQVLIAGGVANGNIALTSAEIFNPDTGNFTPTNDMTTPHGGPAAVLIP